MTEPQNPPAQPTPEQAVELGTAVGQAAEGATTAEQARERAEAAAREQSDKNKLELTDDHIKAISDGVVNAMEARGAFEPLPEPVTAPPAATPPPSEAAAAAAAATAVEPPAAPRKKTFAEKFLGS